MKETEEVLRSLDEARREAYEEECRIAEELENEMKARGLRLTGCDHIWAEVIEDKLLGRR